VITTCAASTAVPLALPDARTQSPFFKLARVPATRFVIAVFELSFTFELPMLVTVVLIVNGRSGDGRHHTRDRARDGGRRGNCADADEPDRHPCRHDRHDSLWLDLLRHVDPPSPSTAARVAVAPSEVV